jgi:hypothetical protein
MKQTAVEWLVEQLNIWQTIADEDTNATLDTVKKLIEKALEMEKERIDNAWDRGYKQGYYDPEFEKENNEN